MKIYFVKRFGRFLAEFLETLIWVFEEKWIYRSSDILLMKKNVAKIFVVQFRRFLNNRRYISFVSLYYSWPIHLMFTYDMSWHVMTYHVIYRDMSWHITWYIVTCHDMDMTCHDISRDMSWHVMTYHVIFMSRYITTCHDMSWYVMIVDVFRYFFRDFEVILTYHDMSWHVMTYHIESNVMSWHVMTYHMYFLRFF